MFSFPCQKKNTFPNFGSVVLLYASLSKNKNRKKQEDLFSSLHLCPHTLKNHTLSFQVFIPYFRIISVYSPFVFIFFIFFRSARIIAKNCWLFICSQKNFLFLSLPDPQFLPLISPSFSSSIYPVFSSFLLHLLPLQILQDLQKNPTNLSSKSSHKTHIFRQLIERIKIPNNTQPSLHCDESSTKRETQTGGENCRVREGWGADPWGVASCSLPLQYVMVPCFFREQGICDWEPGENRGRETTERERSVMGEREWSVMDERERK